MSFAGYRLNKKAVLTIMLILLALSISFAASANTSSSLPNLGVVYQVNSGEHVAFSVPLVIAVGLQGDTTPLLNQPTRQEIYRFIENNPGVHFRGICDSLGLPIGVVQYHLGLLEKAGFVTSYSDGQNKRYFEANTFTEPEIKLISLARHESAGQILNILTENLSAFHRDITHTLGVSSQALSWQMNQLKKAGVVNAEKIGVNVVYSLKDTNAVRIALELTNNSRAI
jgi:DNA-binding transcriptional ArsR family regulator